MAGETYEYAGRTYYFHCDRCRRVEAFEVTAWATLVCRGCFPREGSGSKGPETGKN